MPIVMVRTSLPLVDVIALGALPVELNLADADFVAFEYPSAKPGRLCALCRGLFDRLGPNNKTVVSSRLPLEGFEI